MLRGNWIRILILWLQLETEKAERIAQTWLERTVTLAVLFAIVEAIGLLIPIFAWIALPINIVLGLVLVYRAWAATVVIDVGENLARSLSGNDKDNKKAGTQTMKVVGTVLTVIGVFLSLLLAADYGVFPEASYRPWLAVILVGLFVSGMGAPAGTKAFLRLGQLLLVGGWMYAMWNVLFFGMTQPLAPYLIDRADRMHQLGLASYPSRAARGVILDTAQAYGEKRSEEDRAALNEALKPTEGKQTLSLNDAFNISENAGRHGHEAELVKARGIAHVDGRRLSYNPDHGVRADTPEWQVVHCLDEATDTEGPCKFFDDDVVEGFGQIRSTALAGVIIGPCGISQDDPQSSPYIRQLPRYALIGRIHYNYGAYSEPFSLCHPKRIEGEGTLEARVNADYRDKFERTHPEWHDENSGQFGVRLMRPKK